MRASILILSVVSLYGMSGPASAQSADFHLTYHIERTPSSQLSIEACGQAVLDAAQQAGLKADVQSFPGQLVSVRGGTEGRGAFVVQCIAVDSTTVSVVQGIDYRSSKGSIGQFADKAFDAVKAAIR